MWMIGLSLLAISGCISVGPNYTPPQLDPMDAWHQNLDGVSDDGSSTLQRWWTGFDDEQLNALISLASTNNLDLKTAASRIEQSRALYGVAKSESRPTMAGDGQAAFTRSSSDSTAPGESRDGEFYQVGLQMGWELDLWGRVRRSKESAFASLQASEETYRDLMTLLYAEIASTYIEVRTLQQRILYTEGNLKAQSETMEVTQKRFDAGLAPTLDVSQATLNRARTESTLPPLRQSLFVAVNSLSVLTGQRPYALADALSSTQSIPVAKGVLSVGLPADVIRQRPDIRKAERDLAAQNAQIGVASAELYPSFSLSGSIHLEGVQVGNGMSTAYNLGPQFYWNLFSGGRVRNQIRSEEAATQAALHTYEQVVLSAFAEVEDSLSAYANETDRVQSLEKAVASARESVELVTGLYKSGLSEFENVLIMEQALLAQQDELAVSRGQISINLIAIYRSLGGGWDFP